MCSLMIDGLPHGPKLEHQEPPQAGEKPRARTTCQLYMRDFKDGATIVIEPFRAKAFPVIKDLVVDRSAFDRIIREGRIHFRQHRQCAGRQQSPDSEEER